MSEVHFRCRSRAAREALERAATDAGQTLSDYCRDAVAYRLARDQKLAAGGPRPSSASGNDPAPVLTQAGAGSHPQEVAP